MSQNKWSDTPNFELWEFNKKKYDDAFMDKAFMLELQKVRDYSTRPFIIHEGFAKFGHAPESYHYQGRAADLHVSKYSLVDMALLFYKYTNFSIGLYPEWENKGVHVDDRKKRVFWFRIGGGYHYFTSMSDVLYHSKKSWYQ